MKPIRIALTKGRLENKTVELLERLGYDCTNARKKGRKLIMPIGNGEIEVVLAKAADVVTYVESGVCDMGVVGKDTIMEKGGTFYEVADLGFGKCRFAVATLKEKDLYEGYRTLTIASKYVNVAKNYFEQKYLSTCIITSDTMTALYSVLENSKDAGMVVIAGTGVAIFGKNHSETMLIGGWGHLLREKGSAYAIVHDFCVKMIEKYEAGIRLNKLEYAFLNNYKMSNIREFNHLFYQNSKDEIAKLSIFFKQQAKLGNKQAMKLLKNQGFELAKQTINLMKKLNLKNNTIIGLTGGFIDNDGEYIIEGFKEYMDKVKIDLKYKINDGEQLFGVYKFATNNE